MAMVLNASRLRITQAKYFGQPAAAVGSGFVKTDGSTPLTGNWNVGNFTITALGMNATTFTVPSGQNGSLSAGLFYGSWNLARVFQPAGANGNDVFIGGAGNATLSPGGGAATLASNNVGVGVTAMLNLTTGFDNTAVGTDALYTATTGYFNAAFGSNALGFLVDGNSNTALGTEALFSTTSGSFNVAAGRGALKLNQIGGWNTAVGFNTLFNNLADNNTAVGFNGLNANTTGTENVAIGISALVSNTVGQANVAVGDSALFKNINGSLNTAVGLGALLNGVGASGCVALGYLAGKYETASNSFYIDNQDRTNTAGDKANALLYGNFAATAATQFLDVNGRLGIGTFTFGGDGGLFPRLQVSDPSNEAKYVGIGFDDATDTGFIHAIHRATAWKNLAIQSGGGNVGIGSALPTRTLDLNGTQRFRGIAAPAVSEVDSGTIYYDSALDKLRVSLNGGAYVDLVGSAGLTGSGVASKLAYWTSATNLIQESNITLGGTYTLDVNGDINLSTGSVIRVNAGTVFRSVAASSVVAVGPGISATVGAGSTIVGANAASVSSGSGNTFIGTNSGLNATAGTDNSGLGQNALSGLLTGVGNIGIGRDGGSSITTGSENVIIGHSADVAAGNLTNAVAIGYQASVAANDSMSLGNAAMKVGIRTSTPKQALDVNGAFATRELAIAVANGLNSDIVLTETSWVRLTGPTGAFSIGGFTLGTGGRRLTVYNTTAQSLTIVNEDAASTAANRIKTLSGGDILLSPGSTSSFTVIYDDTDNRWILIGTQGATVNNVAARNWQATLQTLTNGVVTTIALDNATPQFNRGPMWASGSNTRLTVPAGGGGTYVIAAQVTYAASAGGDQRIAAIYKNGTRIGLQQIFPCNGGAQATAPVCSTIDVAAGGDFYELKAQQNSGGNLNTVPGADLTYLSAVKVQ